MTRWGLTVAKPGRPAGRALSKRTVRHFHLAQQTWTSEKAGILAADYLMP